jgi:long-chain fatty acid transport protein
VFSASPTTRVLFQDGGVTAGLTTPSIMTLAATFAVSDRFSVMGTASRTGWSSLREVRIDFDNPDPDAVEDFDWRDSMFYSLGAEYKLSPSWTLRGGLAKDETPTRLATRTPRLPDDDRTWLSLGATWHMSEAFEVNFAYSRIEPDDPRVDITRNGTRIAGPFDGNANLIGVSAQYRF